MILNDLFIILLALIQNDTEYLINKNNVSFHIYEEQKYLFKLTYYRKKG